MTPLSSSNVFANAESEPSFQQPLNITFTGTQTTPCDMATVEAIHSLALDTLNLLVQEHGPAFGVTDLSYLSFESVSESFHAAPPEEEPVAERRLRRVYYYYQGKWYTSLEAYLQASCGGCSNDLGNDVRRVLASTPISSNAGRLRGGGQQRETEEVSFGDFLSSELTQAVGDALFGSAVPMYDCLIGVESMMISLGSPQDTVE